MTDRGPDAVEQGFAVERRSQHADSRGVPVVARTGGGEENGKPPQPRVVVHHGQDPVGPAQGRARSRTSTARRVRRSAARQSTPPAARTNVGRARPARPWDGAVVSRGRVGSLGSVGRGQALGVTAIFFGWAAAVFGTVTVTTPLLLVAVTFSASAPGGSGMAR